MGAFKCGEKIFKISIFEFLSFLKTDNIWVFSLNDFDDLSISMMEITVGNVSGLIPHIPCKY